MCVCVFWRRKWQPTPVLLAGKSHEQRSLVGYSPWGHEESDTTEQLHFHFSLSCIGEGNGNPLQCSCLENPRDGEPGGLLSMGSYRVRHDWSDLTAAVACVYLYTIYLCKRQVEYLCEPEMEQKPRAVSWAEAHIPGPMCRKRETNFCSHETVASPKLPMHCERPELCFIA